MRKSGKLKYLVTGFIAGGIFCSGVVYAASSIKVDFLPLKYYFDGVQKKTPKPGFIYNGTTYVPLRFMADSLGKEVLYNPKTKAIYVTSPTGGPTDLPIQPSDYSQKKIASMLASGSSFYGEYTEAGTNKRWTFKISFFDFNNQTGSFNGKMEFVNTDDIIALQGEVINSKLTFKETKFVHNTGSLSLGGDYVLSLKDNQLKGTREYKAKKGNVWIEVE